MRIWNDMGGRIDWAALPILMEVYGVPDVDLLIVGLKAIREHQERQARGN